MNKKTTAEVVQALGLTRKTLRLILAYHPELCPSEPPSPLTLPYFTEALWSEAEVERLQAYCAHHRRTCVS